MNAIPASSGHSDARRPSLLPLGWGVLLALGLVAVACDNPLSLPAASTENVIDTVTVYALNGTPVTEPSGYDLGTKRAVRTDLVGFDFAFDIDPSGQPFIYPEGALHLDRSPGILPEGQAFDSIIVAPQTGYLDSLPVNIGPGSVFVVRSRPSASACVLATSALSLFGKFLVLSVDTLQRSVTMKTVVNQNCGYHSLQLGTPTA